MERMTWPGARWAPRLALAGLTLGLMLPAPGIVRAASTFKMQPILKIGDTVNGFAIKPPYVFFVGPLNDRGQLAIDVGDLNGVKPPVLLQYEDGQFTTIAGPGLDAAGGKFPPDVVFAWPIGMNQLGNLVFEAYRGGRPSGGVYTLQLGTFLWDNQVKKLTAVELPGMPAGDNLNFKAAQSGYFTPAINNVGEIVFTSYVRQATGPGLFLLGRDGKLQPVVLPGQELPDGGAIGPYGASRSEWPLPFINDAGTVGFVASDYGDNGRGAYLWEQGAPSPLATVGMDAPGGGQFQEVSGAWLNNANPSVLLDASVNAAGGPYGLYRFAGGTLTPLVVPRQEMPGGGNFKDLPWGVYIGLGVSPADDAGQHVFVATLSDNTQGVYLLGTDGKLTLLLKSGTKTELGSITSFGRGSPASFGVSLNNKGQVALPISFDNGPDTIVLLTPTAP